MKQQTSRPNAVAASLLGAAPEDVEHLFTSRRVLVRLEPTLAGHPDARETVILAVNEILRFCPNIALDIPMASADLLEAANALAADIHGPTHRVATADTESAAFDAVLNVGLKVRDDPAWITVSSDGWLARIATAAAGGMTLPQPQEPYNPIGALAAACLGAGQVFFALIERPLLAVPIELSLYSLETGPLGALTQGPVLPENLTIDALLVGCGGVANGWTYAVKRLPITGRIEAVDHQALRRENIGPYVCSDRASLNKPKTHIVRDTLAPAIEVVPRPERFRFFKARIGYGQTAVPDLVISALDNPHTRHDVQRLWPTTTIDLAAEELTAQVIVKNLDDEGTCLLNAYAEPDEDANELAQLVAATGLAADRVADFESQITKEDIAAAPAEKRAALQAAHGRGQAICGRIGHLDLNEEEYSADFTPAVPFVTAFAGIAAAAQTARLLTNGSLISIHFQFSFISYRGRRLDMKCDPGCTCRDGDLTTSSGAAGGQHEPL